jgi:predicted PurR-regulated permease PerM
MILFAPGFIIRLALLEAVAMFGFILAFMHMDIDFFIPFATASVFAYFLNYPTEEKIKKAFK